MSKTREVGSSAIWDRNATIIFCDLCLKEVELGNRPNTYLNREDWQNLVSKFKEETGRDYDRTKLKKKWDQLKKDWKIWKELKRGSTGLGWDPLKRTIDAPEEWWAEKLLVVPAAKKFKFSGIDPVLEEKLDSMFSGVVATGEHAFTPSYQGISASPQEMASEHIGESGEGPSLIPTDVQSTGATKRPRVEKKKQGTAFVRGTIEALLETCKGKSTSSDDPAIKEAIRLLNTHPNVKEDKSM